MAKQFATSAAGTANPLDYKVIKTNKFGKSQVRLTPRARGSCQCAGPDTACASPAGALYRDGL